MSLAAVVLAAGRSSRFGGDKLSARFAGEPLVFHAIRAARAAPVTKVVVVARPDLDCGRWQGAPPLETVRIASEALSDSLRAGIAAVGETDGAFVFLGDMPLIPHDLAARLVARIGDGYAAVPREGGEPGHPVLLARRAFADLAALSGDAGAGRLLRARSDVVLVDCGDPRVRLDIDRPEDMAGLD